MASGEQSSHPKPHTTTVTSLSLHELLLSTLHALCSATMVVPFIFVVGLLTTTHVDSILLGGDDGIRVDQPVHFVVLRLHAAVLRGWKMIQHGGLGGGSQRFWEVDVEHKKQVPMHKRVAQSWHPLTLHRLHHSQSRGSAAVRNNIRGAALLGLE